MAYRDVYAAAVGESLLKQQVAVALVFAARDISNESVATAAHAQRLAWARRVSADPVAYADRVVWLVLENATIAADPAAATDNDVQYVVNSLIPQIMVWA